MVDDQPPGDLRMGIFEDPGDTPSGFTDDLDPPLGGESQVLVRQIMLEGRIAERFHNSPRWFQHVPKIDRITIKRHRSRAGRQGWRDGERGSSEPSPQPDQPCVQTSLPAPSASWIGPRGSMERRLEGRQGVDIAIRTEVGAEDRAEESEFRHLPTPAELGKAIPVDRDAGSHFQSPRLRGRLAGRGDCIPGGLYAAFSSSPVPLGPQPPHDGPDLLGAPEVVEERVGDRRHEQRQEQRERLAADDDDGDGAALFGAGAGAQRRAAACRRPGPAWSSGSAAAGRGCPG